MIADFGTTAGGTAVKRITLTHGDLTVSVLTFGAVLQDVRLSGVDHSLTLGSPELAAYEGPFVSFGSVMGPVANRIRGAQATINGALHTFEANIPGGHTLHSGRAGIQHKVWDIAERSATSLTLTTTAADGDGGFPGNRTWHARYDLTAPATLTLTITADTDAPTLINTVNHSYWNLDGAAAHDGHTLQLLARKVLPVDHDFIPTGDIMDVTGTAFDFRTPRPLTPDDVMDNNYCLSDTRRDLAPAAILTGQSGIRLKMATTDPGLQVYDARHIGGEGFAGHDGKFYGPRAGLALEAQFWPNAPHEPGFPSIALAPGVPWKQVTEFAFDRV
jgi:aldose 1-epimerase